MKTMTLDERLARARTSFLMGEYDLAEKLLEKIVLEKPHLHNIYNVLGSIYERKGKYKEAIEIFHKAIELKPDNSEAYNNLGVAYKNSGEIEKAYTILQKALHVARNKVDIYYNLGNLHRDKSEYPQAVKYYRQALELNPHYILAYNNLGTVLEKSGHFDEAIKVYQQGLQIDINHPSLHYNLGVIFKQKGFYKQAKDEFEYACRIKHGWIQAMNNLGVIYQELGEYERALQIFQDILKSQPQNAEVHNNIAVLLHKQKHFDEAVTSFKRAIQHNPQYGRAHFNLALLYAEQGLHNEALEQLEKIKKIDPEDYQVLYREGSILMILGRYEEAEHCFKQVLTRDAKDTDSLKALTNVYLKQDKIDKAYEIQNRLWEQGQKNLGFHLDLAFIWKDKGEFKKALQEVKIYLEHNPGDGKAEILLADLYHRQGNLRNAEETLIRLIKSSVLYEEAYYLLAKVYRELGDHKKAVAVLKEIVEKQGSSEEINEMDKLNESLKLYEETIKEYEREHDEQWQKNLIKYRELAADFEKQQAEDEDAFLFNEQELAEEESVPIIKVGGMEPVLAVREEEAEITLEESDEALPQVEERRIIEVREEKAPSLMNLLEGQELYKESPYIPPQRAAYPPPPAGASPSYTPLPETSPAPPAYNREEPAGKPVSAQLSGESPSYKDELKDLKNEIRSAMDAATRALQQNVANMQAGAHQQTAAPSPIVIPQVTPQYIAVPQTPLPVEISYREPKREQGADEGEAGVARFTEEDEEEPVILGTEQEEQELEPEINEEESLGRIDEEPAVELLEQEEDALFEDDVAAESKTPEDEELILEEQPELLEENYVTSDSGEDDYEHVRQKASEHADFFSKKERFRNKQPGKLLDYLTNMANYLPQDRRFNLLESEMHMKMQYLRAKLSGNKGLIRKIHERFQDYVKPIGPELTTNAISSTFSFIKNLSSYMPDKDMGNVIALKIDSILDKMRSS
ncbi:MAG: tetratricopeptide repeat protein [Spirochaetales bacterium]|nr:tetratricopeptide repeat protein [Spirochaetales bacterium]